MVIQHCAELIKAAVPGQNNQFELHEPFFDSREENYVLDCIKTRWVSYQGKYVRKFEAMLAQICGVKHAIAVSNGTVALSLSLTVLGIKLGDEVIVPSLTFVATTNAVMHCGAIPHFVDATYKNFGIDANKLDAYLERIVSFDQQGNPYNKLTKKKLKAIIPVHVFGHAANIREIRDIANKYKLHLIEDAAEAVGSYHEGKHLGSWGILSVLSFNGNKIITTGGGGAIITNDNMLADKIKFISTTAKRVHKYDFFHDEVGYNFRLPNINAALGVAQLEKIGQFIQSKRNLAEHYRNHFANNEFFDFYVAEPQSQSNYWLNAIILKPTYKKYKNQILDLLHTKGIKCRPLWHPMHLLPMYKNFDKDNMGCTEDLFERVICLPSSVFLMDGLS